MHRKISLIVFLFLATIMQAQKTTFEYQSSGEHSLTPRNMLEHDDSNIYFNGFLTVKGATDRKRGYVGKLSPQGQLLDSAVFALDGKSVNFKKLAPLSGGGFAVVGSFWDTIYPSFNVGILLAKMDENLVFSDTSLFFLPPDFRNLDLYGYSGPDRLLYVYGGVKIGASSEKPLLYKFNLDFDSILGRIWAHNGIITDMRKLPDGNYWTANVASWRYAKLDENFNLIGFSPPPKYVSAEMRTKWDSDTSFYMLYKLMYPSPPHSLAFARQHHPFDTTGILVNHWRVSDTIDYPGAMRGIDFKHKDSIFIGGTRNLSFNNPFYASQPSWMVVLQTDSLLNIRWERFYGGDAYYIMYKLVATNDGGCLVMAKRFDYQNEQWERDDITILKLNNEGVMVGNPSSRGIVSREAIVYPNPGSNELHLRVGIQHRHWEFSLYDLGGRQVLRQKGTGQYAQFDASALGSGTYIYTITNEQGLNESGKWVKAQ